MHSIDNFKWESQTNEFEWDYGGIHILQKYNFPLRSVTKLHDNSGVVAVFSRKELPTTDNAIIINADGTKRFKLHMPINDNQDAIFSQIFYVKDELTVIIDCGWFEKECILDSNTGEFSNIHMTK